MGTTPQPSPNGCSLLKRKDVLAANERDHGSFMAHLSDQLWRRSSHPNGDTPGYNGANDDSRQDSNSQSRSSSSGDPYLSSSQVAASAENGAGSALALPS